MDLKTPLHRIKCTFYPWHGESQNGQCLDCLARVQESWVQILYLTHNTKAERLHFCYVFLQSLKSIHVSESSCSSSNVQKKYGSMLSITCDMFFTLGLSSWGHFIIYKMGTVAVLLWGQTKRTLQHAHTHYSPGHKHMSMTSSDEFCFHKWVQGWRQKLKCFENNSTSFTALSGKISWSDTLLTVFKK